MCDYHLSKSGVLIDKRRPYPLNVNYRLCRWSCGTFTTDVGNLQLHCCVVFIDLMVSCLAVVALDNRLETDDRLTED